MKKISVILMGLLVFFSVTSSIAQGLEDYAGTYKMDANDYVTELVFSVVEGKLTLSAQGQEPANLAKDAAKTDFFTTTVGGYDAEITFARKDGKISNVELSVGGGAVVLKGAKGEAAGSPLAKYAGVYTMDPNDYIQKLNFEVKEGNLVLVMDGQDPSPLSIDNSKPNFFTATLAGYDCEITFSGEGDTISKIEMSVGGGMAIFTGKK